jgi:peptidoglycan/xylan/chitin deacetylase (PgdA/CDA1 family)
MHVPRKKLILARLFAVTRFEYLLATAQRILLRRDHIRVVNYHGTPRPQLAGFEEHLKFYRRRYENVTMTDLDRLLDSGHLNKDRPGLIICLDDGLRSNLDAARLLERYGFTGWFMIPPGFIDLAPPRQLEFARRNKILVDQDYDDGRVAMSWEELRELAENHVVCCHTATHRWMREGLSDAVLREELVESRQRLEERLGRPIDAFCWVGGQEYGYTKQAARMVRDGYRYAFMMNNHPITPRTRPHQLPRTNIEADWPLDVVAFQVSGAMDILDTPKRRRVNRLTA